MYLKNLFSAIEQLFESQLKNVPFNLDRLGNALCAGDYQATVSGRVGHHAQRLQLYWIILEWIIDQSFRPIDGVDHCHRAFLMEEARGYSHRRGNDIALAILGIGVVVVCAALAPFIWLYVRFSPRKV